MREVTADVFDHFILNYEGELTQDCIDDFNPHQLAYFDSALPLADQLKGVVCYYEDKTIYYLCD